jgi:hypothetical protein
MKKLLSAIMILLLFLGIYSCGKDDASTATTATTDNSTASSPSVFIYIYSTNSTNGGAGTGVSNTCYGTNSSGYTSAPFYSTAKHDLKDRLPSSKWSYPVYSRQGHLISSTWENLWDGNIDMTLHEAEVYSDNVTSSHADAGGVGFWTGTKSDGTFSGNNCRDWSSSSSSDNGTWGSLLFSSSHWIDNVSKTTCQNGNLFLCFMYN